jgi:hypothetical protein
MKSEIYPTQHDTQLVVPITRPGVPFTVKHNVT